MVKNENDVLSKFLGVQLQVDAGIVPMLDIYSSMRNHVDSLSPKEARQAKRCFRKLWRKIVKRLEKKFPKEILQRNYGLGSPNPTPVQLTQRRFLVFAEFQARAIEARQTLP